MSGIFLSRKTGLVLLGLCLMTTAFAEPMNHQTLQALIDDSHQRIEEQVNRPLVFVAVSLSMPEGSLKKLSADAKDAGIALVVRGVPVAAKPTEKPNPTMKEKYGTHLLIKGMAAFEPLVKTGVTLQIDPRAFEVFGIRDVPQLIVADTLTQGQQTTPQTLRVRGDVTLAYALRRLQNDLLERKKTKPWTDFEVRAATFIEDALNRLGGRD